MSLTLGYNYICICSCSCGDTIERPEHGEGAVGEGTGTGTGVLYCTAVPLTCTFIQYMSTSIVQGRAVFTGQRGVYLEETPTGALNTLVTNAEV